jgi:hypothetical protein
LNGTTSNRVRRHLATHHDQWELLQVGCCDPRERVRYAGAGGREDESGLSCRTRVSDRREDGGRFVPRRNATDFWNYAKRIEKRADGATGQTERHGYASLRETLEKC